MPLSFDRASSQKASRLDSRVERLRPKLLASARGRRFSCISSAIPVRDNRTSSARGRHERQDRNRTLIYPLANSGASGGGNEGVKIQWSNVRAASDFKIERRQPHQTWLAAIKLLV
jgi:hypothetical protein